MAKWSDLPLELKEMVVDAVAAQAPYWTEERVQFRQRSALVGPLILLERATSERAASHLWRKLVIYADRSSWSHVSALAAGIAQRRCDLVESAGLNLISWPNEPSAFAEMVECFGPVLCALTSLKFLTVRGHSALIKAAAVNLAQSARNHLKSLSVDSTSSSGGSGSEALASLLHSLSSLEVLRLSGLDLEDSTDLGRAIQSLPSLHTLALSFSPRLTFDTSRTWSSSLRNLRIDNSKLASSQISHLLDAHSSTLVILELYLEYPPSSPFPATFPALKDLDLYVEQAEGLDFSALFSCFKTSPLVYLGIVICSTQLTVPVIVNELVPVARQRNGGLKLLDVELDVQESTPADRGAVERLQSLEGDLVEHFSLILSVDGEEWP